MKSKSTNIIITSLFFALAITACTNNKPAETTAPSTPIMDTIEVERTDTLMVEDSLGNISQKIVTNKEIKVIERK